MSNPQERPDFVAPSRPGEPPVWTPQPSWDASSGQSWASAEQPWTSPEQPGVPRVEASVPGPVTQPAANRPAPYLRPASRSAQPWVTIVLLAVNVLVWGVLTATGGGRSELAWQAALTPLMVADGAWWQLVTSMFTHLSVSHIGLNMLTLWFLGRPLEDLFGRARFLALYLVSGLVASTAVYWLADPESSMVGASGALFGLMGALLVVAWRSKADLRNLLFWLGLNLAFTFVGGAGISWQAHLGGLAGGIVAGLVLVDVRTPRARALGLGAMALACIVAVMARTAMLA